MALTGTPLENTIDELASVLEFLQANGDGGAPAQILVDAALLERHHRLQIRRRKFEVLTQLPEKTVQPVPLDLTAAQRASYQRAEAEGVVELRARGETLQVADVLSLILRLKQICNFCPVTGESAKLLDLRERLDVLTAEGHRMLVFTQFTDDIFGAEAIARGLVDLDPLVFTGGLSFDDRAEVIEKFKSDERHRLLILSLRAGGQGLKLQEAAYVATLIVGGIQPSNAKLRIASIDSGRVAPC